MSKFIDSPRLGVGAEAYFLFFGGAEGAGASCLISCLICAAFGDPGFSVKYALYAVTAVAASPAVCAACASWNQPFEFFGCSFVTCRHELTVPLYASCTRCCRSFSVVC